MSEPAILVKRKGNGSQVWSMEKLDTKLVDMREMFDEYKRSYNDPQCLVKTKVLHFELFLAGVAGSVKKRIRIIFDLL